MEKWRGWIVAVSLVMAVAAAVVAIVFSIAATNPEPIVLGFLNIISIIFSVLAGATISYAGLKEAIEKENGDMVKSVTAKSATELNDFFKNIVTLSRTWNEIVTYHSIPQTTQKSVNDTLENMKDVIQSSMNKIISLGKGDENPYGLYNFHNVARCPDIKCGNSEIPADHLQPYPSAKAFAYCGKCETALSMQRRHDGTISTNVYNSNRFANNGVKRNKGSYEFQGPKTQSREAVPYRKSGSMKATLLKDEIRCSNEACGEEFQITYGNNIEVALRACPICRHTTEICIADGNRKNHTNEFDTIYKETDLNENGKLPCGCGFFLSEKFLIQSPDGTKFLNCFECGSVHIKS